jgi:signal transduction histidine kinase
VVRHAEARTVRVTITGDDRAVTLEVRDDGRGLPGTKQGALERAGHMGITGMRERIAALGGRVELASRPGNGVTLSVYLPAGDGTAQ